MKSRTSGALDSEQRAKLQSEAETGSINALARRHHVAATTLRRALSGAPVSGATLRKLERIAPKVRTAAEFRDLRSVVAPQHEQPAESWDLQKIRNARNAQLLGQFKLPVQLATALRTDDALFTARRNRLSPLGAIRSELVPHASTRGESVHARALNAVHVDSSTLKGIHGTLADHGIAIGYNIHEPNASGTQVEFRHVEWPLEHVTWDAHREVLTTATRGMASEDILHGDGRWVVYRDVSARPWIQNACLLPASFVFAAHTQGVSDWAASSNAHGLAKIVGELPEGVPLIDAEGNVSPEAQAFLTLLIGIVSGDRPAGIRPAGAKTEFLANGSTAWQVFAEFIVSREKAAARIYTGTDALLGSVGGAPGVDISVLFGVLTTLVQSDLGTISRGLTTGVYQPWTAINVGDSKLAPSHRYLMPDADEEQRREQSAANRERFRATLAGLREQGMLIDQTTVNRVASEFSIHPPPKLQNV